MMGFRGALYFGYPKYSVVFLNFNICTDMKIKVRTYRFNPCQ